MTQQFVVAGGEALPYYATIPVGIGQNPNTLTNGLNSNIQTNNLPTLRLSGPTGAFSVGGFLQPGGATPAAGAPLTIINTASQPMTIVNEDAGSAANYRITTQSGVPVTLPPRSSSATFVYDGTTSRWALQNIGLQYPTVLHARDFGATGNGVTDDTAALRSWLAAFQALAIVQVGVEAYLDAGTYVVSGQLTVTGVIGGHIRGAGMGQSIIKDANNGIAGGALGYIVCTNCQQLTLSEFTIHPGQYNGLISGSLSPGATGCSVGSFSGGNIPAVGQRVALLSTAASFTIAEMVTVRSVIGTAVTWSPPLINSYSSSDEFCFGPLAGILFYSDQTLVGAQTSTNNRVDRVFVGQGGGVTCLFGMGATCKGGGPVQITAPLTGGSSTVIPVTDAGRMYVGETLQIWSSWVGPVENVTIQSISGNNVTLTSTVVHSYVVSEAFVANANDSNNEDHIYKDCFAENVVLGGFYAEGQNVLNCRMLNCDVGGITYAGVYAAQGGSFNVIGSSFSTAGWDIVAGGPIQHQWSVVGGASEGTQGLIYSDNAWGTQNLNVSFHGSDHKYGPASGLVVSVHGGNSQLYFEGANVQGAAWSVVDNVGTLGATVVSLTDVTLTCTSVSLSGAWWSEKGVWCARGAPTFTLSGSSTVSYFGRVLANGLLATSIDAPITLTSQTTTTTATGGAGTLPAAPVGFIGLTINGTAAKIPYYA